MKLRGVVLIMVISLLSIGLVACGGGSSGPTIDVSDPWVRLPGGQMEGGQMGGMPSGSVNSAAYMVLRNRGRVADKLLDVKGDVAGAIELHKSEMKDGVMTMNPVDFIDLPAGGEVALKPGGLHIMLIGVNKELMPGKKVTLVLVFEQLGEKTIEAEVRAP